MSTDKQYTDVGMIIPGAPKFRAKAMVDALDFSGLVDNIADSLGISPDDAYRVQYDTKDDRNHHLLEEWQAGLSKDKLWPSPPYAELLEKGMPVQAVIFIRSLRDALPRHAHRPTPETLEAFSELVNEARGFSDLYLGHWEKVLSALPEEPPSYGRIAQVAALASDISAARADLHISSAAYPIPIAPPLSKEAYDVIVNGVRDIPPHKAALDDIHSALKRYEQADENQGNSYFPSGPCPARASFQAIRKSKKELYSLTYRSHASSLEVDSFFRALALQVSERTEIVPDRQIGWHLPVLKRLKIKPATLLEPLVPGATPGAAEGQDTEKDAEKARTKPRRPVRLTADEATALLQAPDDEEAKTHLDLTPLVDMGMVRGIQWGEWVPQKERAILAKNILASFEHFAHAMQITPSLVGLGNPVSAGQREQIRADGLYESNYSGQESLGLALGARGKSAASAHYEPGLHAINLTRLNGAGALSHEIFHGLDYKLTQLIDLDDANRATHQADIRRTTASKKGITTFSQMIANHWSILTFQTDRGHAILLPPTNFNDENERLIKKNLKFEVRQNPELLERVMPLLVGVADFIREMYHRHREPEELLERALDKGSPAIAQTLSAYRTSANNWLYRPDPAIDQINPALNAIVGAFGILTDPDDISLFQDAQRLRRGIQDSLINHDGDLEEDLSNWKDCDHFYNTQMASSRIAYNATAHLSKMLGRNIPESNERTIQSYLIHALQLAGAQAILHEAAANKLRKLNMPPRPQADEHDPEQVSIMQGQLNDAMREVLSQAPTNLLTHIYHHAEAMDAYEEALKDTLEDMPPTADGKMAGLESINLFTRPETNQWATWLHKIKRATQPKSWERHAENISVLRTICDARATPPQRDLTQFSSHFLEAIADAKEGFLAHLESDDYLNDIQLLSQLRSRYNLPDNMPARTIFKKMLDVDFSPEEMESMGIWTRRKLACAMVTTAYTSSPENDGTVATYIRMLRDPTLLGEALPRGLPALYDYIYKNDQRLDMNAEPSTTACLGRQAKALVAEADTLLTNHSMITAGQNLLENRNYALRHPDLNVTLAMLFRSALVSGDVSGIESLENSIDNIGASFRYLPADEKRSIIASFFGNDADKINQLIDEKAFTDSITNPLPVRATDTFGRTAGQLIKASQGIVSRMRKSRSGTDYVLNLDESKTRLPRLAISMRAASETLLHSAAYDGADVNTDPFFINPRSKRGYWYSAVEMFARCSEVALHDVLEKQGISSPYLVTVPSKASQDAQLEALGRNSYPGEAPELNYPAGEERERLTRVFEQNVIPNMENALDALFPDAKPAYEAYQARQAALAEREAMIRRIDAEPDDRMQDQRDTPDAVPNDSSAPETDNAAVRTPKERDPSGLTKAPGPTEEPPPGQCPDTLSLF